MDELKLTGRQCKMEKNSLLKRIDFNEGNWHYSGKNHIKSEDYGKFIVNDCSAPFTNKYVKKIKDDLKRVYRSKKRSLNQKVKKAIQEEINAG